MLTLLFQAKAEQEFFFGEGRVLYIAGLNHTIELLVRRDPGGQALPRPVSDDDGPTREGPIYAPFLRRRGLLEREKRVRD